MKKVFIETDTHLALIQSDVDIDMAGYLKSILNNDDGQFIEAFYNEQMATTYLQDKTSVVKVMNKNEPGVMLSLNNKDFFDENSILFAKENGKHIVKFGNGNEPIPAVKYFVEAKNSKNDRLFDLSLIGDKNFKTLFELYKQEKGEYYDEAEFAKEIKAGQILVNLDENAEMSESELGNEEKPYQKITSKQLIDYINSDEFEFPFSSKVLEDTELIASFRDDLLKKDLNELQAMLQKLKEKNELLRKKNRAENGDKQAQIEVEKIEAINAMTNAMKENISAGQSNDTGININNQTNVDKSQHYHKNDFGDWTQEDRYKAYVDGSEAKARGQTKAILDFMDKKNPDRAEEYAQELLKRGSNSSSLNSLKKLEQDKNNSNQETAKEQSTHKIRRR